MLSDLSVARIDHIFLCLYYFDCYHVFLLEIRFNLMHVDLVPVPLNRNYYFLNNTA